VNHVDHPEIFSVDWCAGYMGIHLGLRRVIPNLRCIAACEIEAYAGANLVAKAEGGWLDSFPIWSDCWTFPSRSFHGLVDIFSAGYPCQPFSFAGHRKGKFDPRHLWPAVKQGIQSMGPSAVFFENVEGHISLGLREVLKDLEALGYQATWGIFSTREVGGSQVRKRVFIYGQLAHGPRGRFPWIRIPAGQWDQGQGTPYIEWAGQALGYTNGQQDIRQHQAGLQHQSGRTESLLGHSTSGRCGHGGLGQIQDGSPAQTGGHVANPTSARLEFREDAQAGSRNEREVESGCEQFKRVSKGLAQPQSQYAGRLPSGTGKAQSRPEFSVSDLASPLQSGYQESVRLSQVHEPIKQLLPPFPPGPGDIDAWRQVLAFDETLEPALCRLAYGRPYRVDELRLAGNGVCPLTAAKAFVTLHRELNP
jgi:DNA (cytosine-5)-methyltransferase 1